MKSYLKIIIILCLKTCFSQEYRPFPSDSASWIYQCSGYQNCCYVKQYQYSTDTLLNGVNYHILKVAQKNYSLDDEGFCMIPQGSINTLLTKYYMREDIAEKKVYLYDILTSTDILLYDFNLEIGDTLPESYFVSFGYYFVTDIDSVLVGTNYHKRYKIDDQYTISSGSSESTYLIEGVGYISDLLSIVSWYAEWDISLNCFSVNEISMYPYYEPSFLSCRFFGADVSIKENENLKLNFYPNPINDFTSEINFSYSSINDLNLKVEIRDMNGKIIDQKKVKINQTNNSFEINSCTNGVYQVYLFEDNELITVSKLVVLK
jgi:hypothetical protein